MSLADFIRDRTGVRARRGRVSNPPLRSVDQAPLNPQDDGPLAADSRHCAAGAGGLLGGFDYVEDVDH